MTKEELLNLANQVDPETNTFLEFVIRAPLGETIRRADNYFTAKGIIEVWEKEIVSAELKKN